jgi:hypothetical protein
MTSSSQQQASKTVLQRQNSYFLSYGKLDTKYLERRLRSAKTESNVLGFTSLKASGTSVQKDNKLSAQS